MGLDMYMYRVKRITEEIKNDVEGMPQCYVLREYSCLLIPENKSKETMYKDIMPFTTLIKIVYEYFDMSKIRSVFHIPDEARVVGESYGGSIGHNFTFQKGTEEFEVKIPTDRIADYTYEKEEKAFMAILEEVQYWRKDYDLQDTIYDLYGGTIENCGYYKMDDYMLDELEDACPGIVEDAAIDDPDNEGIFYHEWY